MMLEKCLSFMAGVLATLVRMDQHLILWIPFEKNGHQILWLPPYSPDLNPIKKMWAWVKKKRKEWLVDSIDDLFKLFFIKCMSI